MATYTHKAYANGSVTTLTLNDFMLYGSGRLGSYVVNEPAGGSAPVAITAANLRFELTDHLGTVRAVVTGQKTGTGQAEIVSLTDYYPYGMDMPGRSFQSEAYRYGYQGSEREPETSGGAGYTTFFRALDPRIGRWLTPDPKVFPWQSPYVSMDANPVALIDPWGASTGGGGDDGFTSGFGPNKVGTETNPVILNEVTVTPLSWRANTPTNRAFMPGKHYYNFSSEAHRYGYSGSFEQYKADYGYKGSYSEVEQEYRAEFGYEYEEEWIPKWDEEEKNRKLLGKLSLFTGFFYAIEDVMYVYPANSIASSLRAGSVVKFSLKSPVNTAVSNTTVQGLTGIADDAFVHVTPTKYAGNILKNGLDPSYSGGKSYVTRWGDVKNITNASDFNTVLYRQDLWKSTAGKFNGGVTILHINSKPIFFSPRTNWVNGVPQYIFTSPISPKYITPIISF